MRRAAISVLLALAALGASAAPAGAHASLLGSVPRAGSRPADSPRQVVLTFSEPVQIVRASDVSVVDGRGRPVGAGEPRTDTRDSRRVIVPVRARLLPDSYTVRYRVISADAHEVDSALVFALAQARLRPPVLRGAGGLSEGGPWAVAARFAELSALGLLLGLLAFRALVWGPAVRRAHHLRAGERELAVATGGRLFWRAFWALIVCAGLAEAFVLAAKSAVVFHTGLAAALTDPAAAHRLVGASRFGDLLGWRGGLLGALAAVAYWAWAEERAGVAQEDRPAGLALPAVLMAGLAIGALTMLSAQGHASQAPVAPLSVLADALHLGAAAVWVGGLPCLAALLLRAPALLPDGGRLVASAALRRFSRVALAAVAVIALTGAVRLAGGLAHVSELWGTDYGRSLLTKLLLVAPIAALALRNRRLIRALAAGAPRTAALRAARRNVQLELAVGAGIVVVAAVLVAQVPGRSAPAPSRGKPPVTARDPGAAARTRTL